MPPVASSSTSSNPSSSKKRRTAQEEADSNDPPPSSPSSTFFFEDGNVLLQVETTLYKVHRGVLQRAEVFADTLLVGSAGQGKDGGIPTIKLEDSVQDWDLFLRALYDGFAFAEKLPTLLQTRSLLILADKYNHRSILEAAKRSFVARSVFEEHHWNGSFQTVQLFETYLRTRDFITTSDTVRRGLLALQEECDLDRSSVRWIHNHLALKLPKDRKRFVHEYKDTSEGRTTWFPRALSQHTYFSILLRVDHFASLAFDTWSDSEILDKHDDEVCQDPSVCRVALAEFWVDIQKLLRGESYDVALKKLALKFEEEVSRDMNRVCASYVSEFWFTTISDFKKEMEKDFDP